MSMSTSTFAHLCRFLNSFRGADKSLMFVQYYSKIWVTLLSSQNPDISKRLKILSATISDMRILLRFFGLVPLIHWILALEKSGAQNNKILFLARLQNFLYLLYYPLEHTWWLGSHEIIPVNKETLNKMGLWSCRFWAIGVFVYFFQLYEEYNVLKRKQEATESQIKKGSLSGEETLKKHSEIQAEKKRLVLELIINTAYSPLTLHWSLENSSFPDFGVGICGTIASIGQIYGAWKATK